MINKLILEDDLYGAVESAFSEGWTRMKLYFLIGLPTETDEDVLAIAALAEHCVEIGKRYTNRASVTLSVGGGGSVTVMSTVCETSGSRAA